jgi:hypothetical protein
MGDRNELWEFRYFDPLRKRWIKARYRATREDIAGRYAEYQIEGQPEVRKPTGQVLPPTGK